MKQMKYKIKEKKIVEINKYNKLKKIKLIKWNKATN